MMRRGLVKEIVSGSERGGENPRTPGQFGASSLGTGRKLKFQDDFGHDNSVDGMVAKSSEPAPARIALPSAVGKKVGAPGYPSSAEKNLLVGRTIYEG